MECKCPILISNKQGVLCRVPCGQCTHCRLNYARSWSIRLAHEQLKYGQNCCIITLTYAPAYLPKNGSLEKSDFQKFMKRLRKQCGSKSIRYYCVGEYGGKFHRAHMHCVLFGIPVDSKVFINRHKHFENGIQKGWHADMLAWSDPDTHEPIGKVHIAPFSSSLAYYVTGYILKKVKGHLAKEYYDERGIIPEFVLMSRKPGLGEDYVRSHASYFVNHQYVTQGRSKWPLPRYYIDKAKVKIGHRFVEAFKAARERYENFISEYTSKGMTKLEASNLFDEIREQKVKETEARLKMKGNRNENYS